MIQEAILTWRYIDTESNLIMPWYTLPALQWLKKQDFSKWRIFEYGCGYSTIWWGVNSEYLTAVDSSEMWARAVGVIFHTEKDRYIEAEDWTPEQYDCFVIDGDWREDCLQYIVKNNRLKSGGHLIIDNWGQEDFPQDACERTEDLLKGWQKQIFKQPNHSTWATAIFTKP